MKPSSLALILLMPLAVLPGALTGVISADDHLTVHHAFQEAPGGHVRNERLSDPAVQFKALRGRVVEELRAGRAPLWNPDIYAGAPLLGDAQSMVGSPVTWLHVALPEDLAQNLGALGVLAWLGLGMGILAHRLGFSALVAAAAAVGTPYAHLWLLHPHAATFCWFPWVILGVERVRAGKGQAGLALAVAGLMCGGHPETAAHGALFGIGWTLLRAPRGVVGWGIGGLLSAPILLPFAEVALSSATLGAHGGNRLEPRQLLDLAWPGLGQGRVWADGVLHPGLGALVLALAGLPRAKRAWAVWLGCVGVALLGLPGPLNNARLASEGALALAIAAGAGATALARRWPRAELPAAGLALLGGLHARWDLQGALPAGAHDPAPAPWTARLAGRLDGARVLGLGWALQPNTGALAGLRDLRGYDLPVSRDTERLMQALDPRLIRPWFPVESLTQENMRLSRFYSVRYIVATNMLQDLKQEELGPAPVYVYSLDSEAPRAWLSDGAWPVRGPEEAIACVRTGRCNRATPPVEGLERPLQGQGRVLPLVVVEEGGALRRVEVPPGEGERLFVFTEQAAPGWEARFAGEALPVRRVAGAAMGVLLPGGGGELELRYRPLGWVLGRWAGLAGLVGLLLAWRAAARRPG